MSVEPERDSLARAIENRREWAIDTLAELVREPTIFGQEESGQQRLARIYSALGYEVRNEPIVRKSIEDANGFSPVDWSIEGKNNLVAIHDPGEKARRSLAFNGHIDVVSPEPVSLWTTPPFEPRVVENEENGEAWMYGRGAGDMKGGTTSFLWALAALQDMGLEPASPLICQSPVEEECSGNGTLAILENGNRTDACIIPEPFNETILLRQVGVIWFTARIVGRTTHVLQAGRGVNAIEKSWSIIRAMRELEDEINDPAKVPSAYAGIDHPANLNVGIIRGGDWASTVAGECAVHFRIGLFPGQSCEEIRDRIEARIREVAEADPWLRDSPPRIEYSGFQAEGCELDMAGSFGTLLRETHRDWRGADPEELSATCTTDARLFSLYYDTPVTCYGPTARDIHGVDEKVSIDSMQRVAEVLADFTGRWCGLRRRKS